MILQKTVLYLLIAISLLIQLSCTKDSDEDVLNRRVNELVAVIENHDAKSMRQYLSDDFSAGKKFKNDKFFMLVHYHFKRNKNISINILNKDIKFNKVNADVTAEVLLLGADDWIPTRGQKYYVESRWKKQSGDWVMSRLRWTIK